MRGLSRKRDSFFIYADTKNTAETTAVAVVLAGVCFNNFKKQAETTVAADLLAEVIKCF